MGLSTEKLDFLRQNVETVDWHQDFSIVCPGCGRKGHGQLESNGPALDKYKYMRCGQQVDPVFVEMGKRYYSDLAAQMLLGG